MSAIEAHRLERNMDLNNQPIEQAGLNGLFNFVDRPEFIPWQYSQE